MFERFNDGARRVVILAQAEARILNHHYIGTEHILLGMLHEGEGLAAQALHGVGVSLEDARHQVEDIIGRGEQPMNGHMPFTPRAKKVFELSASEADRLGHNHVGTEHILLGLIAHNEGIARRVLGRLGVDLDRVPEQLARLLG